MTGNGFRHRGWYSRGYLPHLDVPGIWQIVTFRLADALPRRVVAAWRVGLEEDPEADRELLRRADQYLDRGHGRCLLAHREDAATVRGSLLHFDDVRYDLVAWVVMPNHVHVLARMREGNALGTVVGGWKRYTARRINARRGCSGRMWHPGFFDRFIRDQAHFDRAVRYIHRNPVRAGLVGTAERWEFSSACNGGEG